MSTVEVPSSGESTTRRHFYVGAIYGVWAAITATLGLPALVYLFFPPKIKERQDWTEVSDLSKLTEDVPENIAFRQNRVDGWKITSEKNTAWLLKQPGNSVIAFGPQCTHLGCPYHWDDSHHQFLCPCHNSIFAIDGEVVSGPAPRPLDRYEVKIEGNKVLLGRLRQSSEPA